MHSRPPRAWALAAPRVAEWTLAPGLPPICSQVRAEHALQQRGSTAGPSASLLEPMSEREGWTGQMAGENTKRLISNEKENSSLYIVVLVQYKQNKKSLLLMVSKHPILKRRRGGAQQVDEDPHGWRGAWLCGPLPGGREHSFR